MNKAFTLIDQAIHQGSLTEDEHDKIMMLIHKDGQIDNEEQIKLSELFSAIQTKKVILTRNTQLKKDSDKDDFIKEAILRNSNDLNQERREIGAGNPLDVPSTQPSPIIPSPDFFSNSETIEDMPNEVDDFSHLFNLSHYKRPNGSNRFHSASERLLDINLNSKVWIKTGSMVAYQGMINFRREGLAEHGLGKLLKRGITGESSPLTAAEGVGSLYLADQGKKIKVIELKGVPIYLQSSHILAFENEIKWSVESLFNVGTALAGGLFHLVFSGRGMIAFSARFEPIILRVTPNNPVMTDANATVGWSSGVVPSMKTDVNLQTLIGRTSGETIQLRFEGDGFVIIQPYEEVPVDIKN